MKTLVKVYKVTAAIIGHVCLAIGLFTCAFIAFISISDKIDELRNK